MPVAKARASTILVEFDQAQAELVGKAVVLTDGKAGTVEGVWLGKWPISTIKFAQARL